MGGGFDMQSPNPIALRSRLAEDAFDAPLASKTAGCVAGRVSSKVRASMGQEPIRSRSTGTLQE